MSEAEAYELLMLITSELNQLMFGYFSMVSAFLVMSYLAADKLSALHAGITVALFAVCSAYVVLNVVALNVDLDSLYAEMIARKSAGEYALAWFGRNPVWLPVSLTFVQVGIGLGGFVGSLVFFFSRRSRG